MGYFLGALIVTIAAAAYVQAASIDGEVAKELFLTPLIKAGELDKAKAASEDNMKLSQVKSDKEVKSYSGYLTINETLHSNIFFWFFPAQENPENAPVILWVNDLPGYSCLKGVFLETGPFLVDENNQLMHREFSWTRTHSVIYVDAPVGSGFSFAYGTDAYARNADDEATEVYEALVQFFTLFKDFQPRDFYLAGETFAGTSIPHIAKRIDVENEKGPAVKINMKGFIMGTPWNNPLIQVGRSGALKALGLIDDAQKKIFEEKDFEVAELYLQDKKQEVVEKARSLYWGPESLLAQFTGFSDTRSALQSREPEEIGRFTKFVESKEVHNYLHVGLHQFVLNNELSFAFLSEDLIVSHSGLLQEMLDKGYRVLIYAGQFDILNSHQGVTELIKSLKWKGSEEHQKAPRKIWKVKDDVAGYVKTGGSLTYAIVRNAGNYAILDQPEWTYDLVEKFLYNKGF